MSTQPPTIDESETNATPEDANEKARAESQARRERILRGADDRLDTVGGLKPSSTASGGSAVASADEGAVSTSSKLAALRRRRFKKKEDGETATTGASNNRNNDFDSNNKTKEESSAVLAKEPEMVTEGVTTTEPTSTVIDETIEEVRTPAVQRELEEEGNKKYVGVAKMRRKMLLEKKQQQQQQTHENNKQAPAIQANPHTAKPSAQRKAERMAIAMHVLVVVLLFVAGLDVGLQGRLDYGSNIVVHTDLAPREMKFLDAIPAFLRPKPAAESTATKETDVQEDYVALEEKIVDEFADESKPHIVSDGNLDPLFGVDLDKMTQGPGLYMTMARLAVSVHRVNLALFYYAPKKVILGIISFVKTLILMPPLLAIIALFLRQVLGNNVLGAILPKISEDETQGIDVVSTMLNTAKNFVSGMFPRASGFYRGWMMLRADMYVVTCGLVVGLAWQHGRLLDLTPPLLGTDEDLLMPKGTVPISQTVGDKNDEL